MMGIRPLMFSLKQHRSLRAYLHLLQGGAENEGSLVKIAQVVNETVHSGGPSILRRRFRRRLTGL
jgi:hypothetical protein